MKYRKGSLLKEINNQLGKAYFPNVFKYISLIAFILILIIGFSANSTDVVLQKELRNTNLGSLVVWSYWWPFIVLFAIFFGRIWCMVCPVEIITTFFAKIGFRRKRPSWLLSGWAITIFYILILLIGIQGLAIHRNPFYMSLYLLAIVSVSVVVGALFEKNTFCRYVCPVGYLLGIYSKLSFFGWRVGNKSTCDTCKDKSCIHKDYQYNLNVKSCGVDLYPATIEGNEYCILCAGCLKTCNNYQSEKSDNRPNPQLTYIGFANELFKLKPLKMAEMAFVFIVSGFVISEIWSEWDITKDILGILPSKVNRFLMLENEVVKGISKGIVLFAIVPFLIWLVPFLISRLVGAGLSVKNYVLNYSIAFIPILAAAHLDKAILKTTSRLPYFEHLSADIIGKETALKIVNGTIVLESTPVWLKFITSFLVVLIMIIGVWLSVTVVKRLNKKMNNYASAKAFYLIPILYGGIFIIMLIAWRWIY